MARSDEALRRARDAYERAHVTSGLRGVAVALGLTALAIGLHRTTSSTWLVAALLGATLATLGWRGGVWRRGALAGVLAGLPVFVAPVVVFALGHGGHCPDCELGPTWTCLVTCFGTSSLAGIAVGRFALADASPPRFAAAAFAAAVLTGLLGCATTGLGGATGIVIGLGAGSVAGWVTGRRAAHA
jgi:hypothetical protein